MGSLIVGGARTPIAKLLGGFKDLSATDLGGHAISAALARAGVTGDQIDYVIMGQVLQGGVGQIPARQAAVKGGVSMSVPALTVNKVCLSGLNAIALADQLIRAGECELVVAGGMESMTQAPHLLPGARAGIKFGNATLVDSMAFDGLWDVFTDQAMGALTEHANHGAQAVTREDQDAFAVRSHLRAQAATDAGLLAEEIAPVVIPQRRGADLEISVDEGIRPDAISSSGATAAGLLRDRHRHGRVRQSDLGRGGRRGRRQSGRGRAAGAQAGGRDRRLRPGGRSINSWRGIANTVISLGFSARSARAEPRHAPVSAS